MQQIIQQYKILVEFLGKALGPDYEIVLHDLSNGKNEVVAIANSEISGRQVGAPLTNLALKFLADKTYEHEDYEVGYAGISPKNAQLYTSTLFIKSNSGRLIGILCINYDMTHCKRVLEDVQNLCGIRIPPQGVPEITPPAAERFQGSVQEVVRASIAEITNSARVPASRLTMEEKIQIVGRLKRNGVFYLKGAVSEVADCLETSEATIYRYLSKVRP